MRIWLTCLASAVIGGLVSATFVRLTEPTLMHAQEPPTLNGPGLPAPRTTPQPTPTIPVTPPGQAPKGISPSPQWEGTSHNPGPVGNFGAAFYESDALTPEEQVSIRVYEDVNRSVVNITTRSVRADNFFLQAVPEEGTGSGLVIDQAGHILTNFHVIEDVREVVVTLYDGETYDATYVGADPVNDLAVIRVEAPVESLIPVRMGDSANLKVGMNVYAIGNPFGLERTLTTGIISSLNRSLKIHRDRTIKSIIQIDAAVNPGNSGGPLLDSHGRMIGINTAIYSATGQSSGVGFAIPVNLAKRVIPQLIRHGRVIRPEIGISRVYETENGLLVAQLVPGGPAEKAGIRGPQVLRERRGPFVVERTDRTAADTITHVDGEKISTVDDFLGDIESRNPGDTITLTVLRDGKSIQVPMRLGGEVPLKK